MTADPTYRISELAAEFDITARALRFYEDKGLLAPSRQGQNRIYSNRDRARLSLVLRGKRLGFSLDEIREMIELYDLPDGQIAQLKISIEKFRTRIESLEQQRRDIDATMKELESVCGLMEQTLADKISDQERSADFAPSATGFAGPLRSTVTN